MCDLPLNVDIERGYRSNTHEIANNISALAELGLVGINIEDSIVKGQRRLADGKTFANALTHLVIALKHRQVEIFINVRSDAYLALPVVQLKGTTLTNA